MKILSDGFGKKCYRLNLNVCVFLIMTCNLPYTRLFNLCSREWRTLYPFFLVLDSWRLTGVLKVKDCFVSERDSIYGSSVW